MESIFGYAVQQPIRGYCCHSTGGESCLLQSLGSPDKWKALLFIVQMMWMAGMAEMAEASEVSKSPQPVPSPQLGWAPRDMLTPPFPHFFVSNAARRCFDDFAPRLQQRAHDRTVARKAIPQHGRTYGALNGAQRGGASRRRPRKQ